MVSSPRPNGARTASAINAAICSAGTGNDNTPTPSTPTFGIGNSIRPCVTKSSVRFTPASSDSNGSSSRL